MADQTNNEALLSALTTEHFVMQSAIGTSVNEQQARASMFLYSLSGALVATGFMAQSDHLLLFVAAVLPLLFLTGLLTTFRLVDIAMESFQSHVTIARIRAHYRSLGGASARLFDTVHGRWPEGRTDSANIVGPLLGLMTTAASMIACVNAFVGSALLVVLLTNVLHLTMTSSIIAGAALAVAQVTAFYRYQKWRIGLVVEFANTAGVDVD